MPTPDFVPVMHPQAWARRPGEARGSWRSPDLEWVLQQRSDVTVLPSDSERGAGRSVVGCRFPVRARPDPHRDHAVHGAGGHRRDGHRHRRPVDRGSLGGFAEFPWLFSVYLLAQAVTVPVYGKLADVFGRKPVMLLGIGLFLVGSILCGAAWSMGALIAFRAVQGLGAGAVQPMSMTIVGDLY